MAKARGTDGSLLASLPWTLLALAWLAVLSTIQSGVGYVIAAGRYIQE